VSDTLPHILVVDDDRRLRDLLQKYLSENSFRVTTAGDAAAARAKLAGVRFDLLVLDVMMPGEDGVSLTASLRRESDVPILLLTARGEVADRISGLEAGADDYLPKPFEPRELVLRIGTILRRAPPRQGPPTVRFGDWTYDLAREELRRGNDAVRLTAAEASLLRALAERAGAAMTREELIAKSQVGGSARTVDVQVTRLRRKIEPDPRFPRYIVTQRGSGYMLLPD
jgi:two-component system phosphate regulon response regulator OmpR